MSDAGWERVAKALDRLTIVMAAIHANGLRDDDLHDKAEKLSSLGFSNVQIAAALGMTPNAVNVALHKRRKKARGRSKPASSSKRSPR